MVTIMSTQSRRSISFALAVAIFLCLGKTSRAFQVLNYSRNPTRQTIENDFLSSYRWIHATTQNDRLDSLILHSSPQQDDDDSTKVFDIGNSLEILALSVSAFFVATLLFVGGDKLFAASPTTSSSPRVVIDADAVLREDFEKSSTTVLF